MLNNLDMRRFSLHIECLSCTQFLSGCLILTGVLQSSGLRTLPVLAVCIVFTPWYLLDAFPPHYSSLFSSANVLLCLVVWTCMLEMRVVQDHPSGMLSSTVHWACNIGPSSFRRTEQLCVVCFNYHTVHSLLTLGWPDKHKTCAV